MPIKALLFDFSGTLCDDLELVAYPSIVNVFQIHGVKPPSLQEYRSEMTSNFMEFYHQHGLVGLTQNESNNFRTVFYTEHGRKARLRPMTHWTLKLLKDSGLKLAILSGEVGVILDALIDQYDIRQYFDLVHGEAWPKRDAFPVVLEKLGISAGEAAYADDTEEGITVARECGLQTIGMVNPTAYCLEDCMRNEVRPDRSIGEIWQLPYLMMRWNQELSKKKSA